MLNTIKLQFLVITALSVVATSHLSALRYAWDNGTIDYEVLTDADGTALEPPAEEERVKFYSDSNTIDLGNSNALLFGIKEENHTISANINDSGEVGGGVIAAGGKTVLSGVNTYRSGTLVQGILEVSADHNLGAPTSPLLFDNGVLAFANDPKDVLNINRYILINDKAQAHFSVPENSTVILRNPISGTTSEGIVKNGKGTLGLASLNEYSGLTVINEGTLLVNANNLPTNVVNNAILSFYQEDYGHFQGSISGSGGVIVSGQGTLHLSGINNHLLGTLIQGTLSIESSHSLGAPAAPIFFSDGILAFTNKEPLDINRQINIYDNLRAGFSVPEGSTVFLNSPIIGEGSGGIVKMGAGTLKLTSPNNYAGITEIREGELSVHGNHLPTDVVNNGILTFQQYSHGIYEKQIYGGGIVNVTGGGILKLTGDSSKFTGTTNIENGHILLQNTLGGNVHVSGASSLRGVGAILGSLTVGPNSIIAPGNSIGSMIIGGDYIQADGTYLVQVNGLGQSSFLDIIGTATLGGNVIVSSTDGTYNVLTNYTILEADGGIAHPFDSVEGKGIGESPTLFTPVLTYDDTHVFLKLNPALIKAAKTFNQKQVATQIDSIVNPTPSQLVLLNTLVGLSEGYARHALNQMSGQQHAADLLVVELLNRQFIRRLYDPLRDIVGSDPCTREWYELENCCTPCGVDAWFEGSGSRLSQKGGSNTTGFKAEGGEISLGIQKTFCSNITTGIAGSYEFDDVHYHLGGHSNINSFMGGVYALYRPARFYLLTDLAFSYSINKMNRPIQVGPTLEFKAKSTPKISQLTFYGEAGVDYLWEDLLIQPFIGVEVANFWRTGVTEHGAGDLNLIVNKRKRTATNTRLGVHLSVPNLPSDFNLFLDLAWIYRWTARENNITEHYQTFGSPNFLIQGIPLYKNNFEGTLAITKEICDRWNFVAEFSGQFWKRSCSYYILGGIERSW